MTKQQYLDYLESPDWKRKTEDAKRRAGHQCLLCTRTGNLEVHHRTYQRLGNELPHDLVVLCWRCHRRHHGTYDEAIERQLALPI